MIRRVADVLLQKAEELVVSTTNAKQTRELSEVLPEATFARDRRQDRGPIEGLWRGLEAARGDLVLVAPCDAPFLGTGLYDVLLRVLGNHDAAVPRLEVMDPLRAVYRKEAPLRTLRMDRGGISSPSALVDRLDVRFVDRASLRRVDSRLASFMDVNTLEDYNRALDT